MNPSQTIALYQPLLHTIAYNIVRCKQDAEDIVQDTFIKWLAAERDQIANTKAYLIRAVTNNCINHLESIRRKKVEYLDNVSEAWLKFRETNLNHLDLDVNLSAAFQVLTSKLEPVERAVYLLKEVFDFDYDTLQATLDRKKDHCRQLLCRARKKLSEETSRINLPDSSSLLNSFKAACDLGNASELIKELKKEMAEKKFF